MRIGKAGKRGGHFEFFELDGWFFQNLGKETVRTFIRVLCVLGKSVCRGHVILGTCKPESFTNYKTGNFVAKSPRITTIPYNLDVAKQRRICIFEKQITVHT